MSALPGYREAVREICLSSLLHDVNPGTLRNSGAKPTVHADPLIDDFSRGLRDWFQLNAGHLARQQTWTRKLTDPLYRGATGRELRLTLRLAQANRLTFVIVENEWRSYRGPRRTFTCVREVPGIGEDQTLVFSPTDFSGSDGVLAAWDGVDSFGICAHYAERSGDAGPNPVWHGPSPTFVRLAWS